MATISAADVKQLREMTNLGMMDCKRALVETDGDMEAAVALLREKNKNLDVKKADRAANEGAVGIFVVEDGRSGAIIEVNCETDFVARNEAFRELVYDLAYQAALSGDPDVETFLSKPFIKDEGKTVKEKITDSMSSLGENIVVGRFATVGAQNGVIGSYVHSDAKKGALVVAEGANTDEAKEVAREIAMQAVALRAPYLNREKVPSDVIDAEKELYLRQVAEEGQPEEKHEMMAMGRVNKFFIKENVLVEQSFIKDNKKSVADVAKKAGVTIDDFVRYEIGQ